MGQEREKTNRFHAVCDGIGMGTRNPKYYSRDLGKALNLNLNKHLKNRNTNDSFADSFKS